MIPTTDVHICNLALDKLGQDEIASINPPSSQTEIICARHYDQVRRKVLRKYIFNFSKKYITLTKSATKTPAFGYSSAYALPTDFVRLLTLGDTTIGADTPPGLYELSEGYIFTDSASTVGGTLNLSYIFDSKNVATYDSLFVDVFVLELASDMAVKITVKPSIMAALDRKLEDAQMAAAAVAGQEKPPRRIQNSRILSARQGFSAGRLGNTRH